MPISSSSSSQLSFGQTLNNSNSQQQIPANSSTSKEQEKSLLLQLKQRSTTPATDAPAHIPAVKAPTEADDLAAVPLPPPRKNQERPAKAVDRAPPAKACNLKHQVQVQQLAPETKADNVASVPLPAEGKPEPQRKSPKSSEASPSSSHQKADSQTDHEKSQSSASEQTEKLPIERVEVVPLPLLITATATKTLLLYHLSSCHPTIIMRLRT